MHPIRDRNSSNVAGLPTQVYDCPMPLPLLEVRKGELGEFVPTESASQEQGEQCTITFALELVMLRRLPECLCLFRRQPVAEPYAQFLYALYAPYPGS
jgi:hypothetical protein